MELKQRLLHQRLILRIGHAKPYGVGGQHAHTQFTCMHELIHHAGQHIFALDIIGCKGMQKIVKRRLHIVKDRGQISPEIHRYQRVWRQQHARAVRGGIADGTVREQGDLIGFFDAGQLPLYGYTAVAVYKDELYAAAIYTDENHKWAPENYNTHDLKKLVRRVKKDLPDNPLVEHLANCSLEWHCCTAENLFYRRWECGIPTSPVCNANCFGCISLQPAECCPSPQSRIKFRPTPEEIAEIGIYHLETAPEGIISFGQGCEGEPSLAADNISAGISLIRAKTGRGQININTNAGYTEGIRKIVDAGLDTMRVSIISAIPESYAAYYRSSYQLEDVKASIRYALEHGIYVSLNMLYFPGFNDRAEELAAWKEFFRELPVQMIQVRNLNIDPDAFLAIMPEQQSECVGTKAFLQELHQAYPELVIGSFSHYVEK